RGALAGGIAGAGLAESAAEGGGECVAARPSAPMPGDALRVVPLADVFGSDELAALSPPVAERIPEPCVVLGPEDADARGIADGMTAEIELGETSLALPVRVVPGLAAGTLGVPIGLPGMPFIAAETAKVGGRGTAGDPR